MGEGWLPTSVLLAARRALRTFRLGGALRLLYGSGLAEAGWFESYKANRPIDRAGRPIPWYSYGAIHFLDLRLRPELRVFEYGAGNSSRWYAERVAEVVAVEHDEAWMRELGAVETPGLTILHHAGIDEYLSEIRLHEPFDVVVIDGRERVRATEAALGGLREDGVIVWDNSDWTMFAEALELVTAHGFRELPFRGLIACYAFGSTTSILYRPNNCLGI